MRHERKAAAGSGTAGCSCRARIRQPYMVAPAALSKNFLVYRSRVYRYAADSRKRDRHHAKTAAAAVRFSMVRHARRAAKARTARNPVDGNRKRLEMAR